MKHLGRIALLVAVCALNTTVAHAWTFYNSNVKHIGQPEKWACGPTTIAMWAGSTKKATLDPYKIADQCCGRNGTNIPEFMKGMISWTPKGYYFAEWEYKDREAAVKGIMYTIAQYGEPVAIAGGDGTHYLVVRGGRSEKNPYSSYGAKNAIQGVYVNDATEASKHYKGPVSGMYKNTEYNPSKLMAYWTKIGSLWDKKYRSIERECCSSRQGKTYDDNSEFTNY
ncbi:MAG: hypothetical protein ACXW5J_24950 [Thermoanaerobaculia bacterium]